MTLAAATMIGILLVVALLAAVGFFHSHLFAHHKKALVSRLLHLLSPCCKPMASLAATSPPEASPAEKHKDVVLQQHQASAAPEAELESVFRTFDSDGDGFITAKELEESLRRLGLLGGSVVEEMLARVDSNGDGRIDMDEFRELYGSIAGGHRPRTVKIQDVDEADEEEEEDSGVDQDDEAEMREAFEVFDRDGDGLIGAEELRAVLGSTGLRPGATGAECRDMIQKVDLDGDGMVNFHEFKRMMLLTIPTTEQNESGKGKML